MHNILRILLIILGFVHLTGLYGVLSRGTSGDINMPDAYFDLFLSPFTFVVGVFSAWMLFKTYKKPLWALVMLMIAVWWNVFLNPFSYVGEIQVADPINVWNILNFSVAVIAFCLTWKVEDYKASD